MNQNGKRALNDYVEIKKLKRLKKRKVKKTVKPAPVYTDNVHPTALLNQLLPNSEYTFSVDTSQMNRVRFVCQVKIEQSQAESDVKTVLQFEGDGVSKKDAKRKCCIIALMNLYSDTYKPPAEVVTSLTEPLYSKDNIDLNKESHVDEIEQVNKRIKKICTKEALKSKSPSQLLYEVCKSISNTGECVSENGQITGKKYTYQFKNKINGTEQAFGVVFGFGSNKKEAKNDAAKQALKTFLNCDLDLLAIS